MCGAEAEARAEVRKSTPNAHRRELSSTSPLEMKKHCQVAEMVARREVSHAIVEPHLEAQFKQALQYIGTINGPIGKESIADRPHLVGLNPLRARRHVQPATRASSTNLDRDEFGRIGPRASQTRAVCVDVNSGGARFFRLRKVEQPRHRLCQSIKEGAVRNADIVVEYLATWPVRRVEPVHGLVLAVHAL